MVSLSVHLVCTFFIILDPHLPKCKGYENCIYLPYFCHRLPTCQRKWVICFFFFLLFLGYTYITCVEVFKVVMLDLYWKYFDYLWIHVLPGVPNSCTSKSFQLALGNYIFTPDCMPISNKFWYWSHWVRAPRIESY